MTAPSSLKGSTYREHVPDVFSIGIGFSVGVGFSVRVGFSVCISVSVCVGFSVCIAVRHAVAVNGGRQHVCPTNIYLGPGV
jgi:hypothetical protein